MLKVEVVAGNSQKSSNTQCNFDVFLRRAFVMSVMCFPVTIL